MGRCGLVLAALLMFTMSRLAAYTMHLLVWCVYHNIATHVLVWYA